MLGEVNSSIQKINNPKKLMTDSRILEENSQTNDGAASSSICNTLINSTNNGSALNNSKRRGYMFNEVSG